MISIVLEEELLGSQWVANLDKLYRKHLSTTRVLLLKVRKFLNELFLEVC